MMLAAGGRLPSCLWTKQVLLQSTGRPSQLLQSSESTLWKQIPSVRRRLHVSAASQADIVSVSNDQVKHCCKLRTNRQYRSKFGRVLLVGQDLLDEVTEHAKAKDLSLHIHSVFIPEGQQPPSGIEAGRVATVADHVMAKLAGLQNVEGVQAVTDIEMPKPANLAQGSSKKLQRLLAIEGLQDPGNLGTLLRTAVGLGWDACFLLPGCCDPFNDKALKAGRGAAFKLPIDEGNWEQLQQVLQKHNMQCFGAGPSQQADTPTAGQTPEQHMSAISRPLCVVLGNEGQGLSDTAKQQTIPLAIPMTGPMDSLNVSQAGAILMFALSNHAAQLYQQLGKHH